MHGYMHSYSYKHHCNDDDDDDDDDECSPFHASILYSYGVCTYDMQYMTSLYT